MRHKILLLILALLCVFAQGAWAQVVTFPIQYDDVWDGHSTEAPPMVGDITDKYWTYEISKAAHLAWIRDYWENKANMSFGGFST